MSCLQVAILDGRAVLAVACACLVAALCGCTTSKQSATGPSLSPGLSKPALKVGEDLPPSAVTLHALADILASQHKDKDCEFVLRSCVRQYPQFTPAHNSLAELFMRQGRVNEAIEILSGALQVNPRDPVLLNNLGMCLLVSKQYDKALASFTDAAAIAPAGDKYRANMATALGLLGRQDEARALLEQVVPAATVAHNAAVLQKARETLNGSTTSLP